MIVVDANLLLYAYDATSDHHAGARTWLETILDGPEPVRFPLVTLLAFVRIGTNRQVFEHPLDPDDAVGIVARWLRPPFAAIAAPTAQHWQVLAETMRDGQVRGTATTDAHLAALTIEHGGVLHTADRGFARYPGLSLANPLDDAS